MKVLSISLIAISFSHSACFCPSRQRHSRFTTPWSSRQPHTTCSRFSTAIYGSADALLRMVEEVSEGQFSPAVMEKMGELEQALTTFLSEEKASQGNRLSPHPPEIPPPLKSFIREGETREERDNSLIKAEQALETLRLRLRQEEETLRLAEEALHRSMEEQEVLRRAERALQKSRAAAEQRKVEAIRYTEQAMATAEQTRIEKEEAEQLAQEFGLVDNVGDGSDFARPTISLSSFDGIDYDYPAYGSESPDGSSDVPLGVPSLFDWVQYVDGSITGRVKGSYNFPDGSQISTSPVPAGAMGGTIITTQSGTQYYLEIAHDAARVAKPETGSEDAERINGFSEEPTNGTPAQTTIEDESARRSLPKVAKAPPGTPTILNWELMEDGGISGLIYGSPNAEDGDYVETSPIAQGPIESGYVVQTCSGSNYFLSPDQYEREENVLAAFKDLAAARRGRTITITKDIREKQAQDAMEVLRHSEKRSTFSLGDLFGAKDPSSRRPANNGNRGAQNGVPTLSRWSTNADGTITGVVYGSMTLNDGDLVTTSPIAQGEMRENGMVTTISGSTYYLE